jgi:hypothetical protein
MSEEDCGICGLDLNDKFSYKLDCGHKFHYECLMKSFNNISYTINNKKNNLCPYCRKNSDYLPLVNGLKKVIPGVHCNIFGNEIDDKKQELKEKYSQKCGYNLTRGKNKGNSCGKNCVLGYGYCKSHLEKMKSKHGDLVKDLSLPTSNDKQPDPQVIMNV